MENQNLLNKKKTFDIFDGALACLVFVILEFVFSLAISYIPRSGAINTVLTVILELLFVAASFSVVLFRNKDIYKSTTLNKKFNGKIVLFALAIAGISIIAFSRLTSGFIMLMEKFGYQGVLGDTNVSNFGLYVLSIITVCVVPAFCEELLFRGVVLNSFRGLNKWIGIIVSGFLFMLMHGNPDQTVHQLLLGIILGYIAWETKNIWVTMLIHFFNNFIAITITFITQVSGNTGSSETGEITSSAIAVTLITGILFAVAGVVAIIYITKYIKKQSEKVNQNKVQVTVNSDNASETIEAEITNVEQPVDELSQEKPNRYKVLATIATYGIFIIYFAYQWIKWLIVGFGG